MELILLDTIKYLGALGDKVNVKPGYGRNYLVPQGKAIPVTAENLAAFETRRAELEQHQSDKMAVAQAAAARLAEMTVIISGKASSEGKLYGSVSSADIAKAATDAGVEINKNMIRVTGDHLRQVGEYEVTVHLHSDVDATLTVHVVAED
jgi:large subunit ribosomal protein L9